MGFVARRVHCRPYDAYDIDSHVVTAVFLPDGRRWIFLDASWGMYVTDPGGTLLGLWEFRDCLAARRPVWIRGRAEPTRGSDFYLGYMAKNLFWMASPVTTAPALRTKNLAAWLPFGFLPMDLRDQPKQADDVQIVRSPASFWAAPVRPRFSDAR